MSVQESPLAVKSENFSVWIVKMVQYLNTHCDRELKSIYNQVLRSGTSIAANIGEAEFAQSPADMLAKLSISLKEANETKKMDQTPEKIRMLDRAPTGQHVG